VKREPGERAQARQTEKRKSKEEACATVEVQPFSTVEERRFSAA
jgi:hypothetical protein